LEQKLTQEQLAAIVGAGKQAANKWEKGVTIPPLETLWPLADFFGVTMDYLIGRSDDPVRH
jgi:transcriptional regulator with XRE-family HTH domain